MTKESTGKVLEGIINDADLAGAVAEGDFTGFADEELTDAERALLQAAAADLDDEVTGFGVFAKYDGVDGESRGYKLQDVQNLSHDKWAPSLQKVFGHVGIFKF